MRKTRFVLASAAAIVAAGVFVMQCYSQQGGPPGGGQGGPGGGQGGGQGGGWGGGQFDPEQMRQMMMNRIKETLGATDEEWKVLGPKIEKVQELSRQARSGGRMFGGRGGFGGPGGGQGGPGGPGGGQGGPGGNAPQGDRQPQREQSAVEKAVDDLRTTLDNQDAKPDVIKAKLLTLRETREKAKQELAQAQEELRQILTLRQEAQLVLMGMLE